jgi:hypothetical protein
VDFVTVSLALELFLQTELFLEHGDRFVKSIQRRLLELDLMRTARVVVVVLVVEARPGQIFVMDILQSLSHFLNVAITGFHFFRLD